MIKILYCLLERNISIMSSSKCCFSLKRLEPLAAFITIFDASGNAFTSLCEFSIFPRLTYLTVDSNPIQRFVFVNFD